MEHCYYKYPPADAPLPNPIPLRDPIFPASQHAIACLEQLDLEEDERESSPRDQPNNEAGSTDLRTTVTRWRWKRFRVALELSRLSFIEFANRALEAETPSEIHIDVAFAEAARRIVALAFYIWHERYRDRLAYADKRWLEALLTEWIQEAKGVWRRRALDSCCQEWVPAGFDENWHWPKASTFIREGIFLIPPETELPPTDTVENVWADSSNPEVRAWVDRSLAFHGSSWLKRWARATEEPGEVHRESGGSGGMSEPAADTADDNGADRRAAVDAYIEEILERTGKRITRTDIWKLAGYKSRTEFERWERDDPEQRKTRSRAYSPSPVFWPKNRT